MRLGCVLHGRGYNSGTVIASGEYTCDNALAALPATAAQYLGASGRKLLMLRDHRLQLRLASRRSYMPSGSEKPEVASDT